MGGSLPKTQYLGAISRHSPSTDKPGNENISIHQGVTGNKLAATGVNNVLGMCLYAPCRLRICTHRWSIRTGAYAKKKLGGDTPPSVQMRKRHGIYCRYCTWAVPLRKVIGVDFLVARTTLKQNASFLYLNAGESPINWSTKSVIL